MPNACNSQLAYYPGSHGSVYVVDHLRPEFGLREVFHIKEVSAIALSRKEIC